ncbi:MAG: sugar ABC transporter permease [Chloroflexota bacterium]|nr:sugar ABC transporter permease [Chloroflexota bacterium]
MATSQQVALPPTREATARRGRERPSAMARSEARFALWLVLPAMLTIAAVAFLPLGRAAWLSLWRINLRFANTPRTFEGLGNYQTIFGDERFHNALRVTATIAGATLLAELVLGMIIALTINRTFRGRGLARAAVLVPWALTTVVAARSWQLIYQADTGIFNRVLADTGIERGYRPWIADPTFAIWAMIGADVWKTTPFVALLLLAGLQLIPQDLNEASGVDGATPWQTFWRVTVPLLRPTILVALLFRLIDVARMFDLPFVLTGGGPGFETETLTLYTYRTLFQNLSFGLGSALAVTTFLIVMVISFVFVKVLGAPVGRDAGAR